MRNMREMRISLLMDGYSKYRRNMLKDAGRESRLKEVIADAMVASGRTNVLNNVEKPNTIYLA